MTDSTDGIIGWRWLDRRLHRRAGRRVRAAFVPSLRRRAATVAVAVAVQGGAFATLLLGAWLCTVRFPSVALLPGVILVLFGVLTLPRPARLPRDVTVLRRADAPAVHALTDRAAAGLGVPRPHTVVVDERFAADSGYAGVLRRRYLRIGAPLWAVLDPAQRGALVALELARFGAGDPSRSPLTGTVERTLATMVAIFEPGADKRLHASREHDATTSMAANPQRIGQGHAQSYTNIAGDLVRPFIAVVHGAFGLIRAGYLTLLQPDALHAVHTADARAAAVAGVPAVRSVLTVRLLAESMITVLRRDARAGDRSGAIRRDEPETVVAGWPGLAAGVLVNSLPSIPARCDADIARSVSPFAVIPPLGRRIELLGEAPHETSDAAPATVADPEVSAATDVELRQLYRRIVRDLRNG